MKWNTGGYASLKNACFKVERNYKVVQINASLGGGMEKRETRSSEETGYVERQCFFLPFTISIFLFLFFFFLGFSANGKGKRLHVYPFVSLVLSYLACWRRQR